MTATKMNLKLTLAATVAAITMCATAATGKRGNKHGKEELLLRVLRT